MTTPSAAGLSKILAPLSYSKIRGKIKFMYVCIKYGMVVDCRAITHKQAMQISLYATGPHLLFVCFNSVSTMEVAINALIF